LGIPPGNNISQGFAPSLSKAIADQGNILAQLSSSIANLVDGQKKIIEDITVLKHTLSKNTSMLIELTASIDQLKIILPSKRSTDEAAASTRSSKKKKNSKLA
jgi:hypothetical protein